jgi:hypothetical protein
MILARQSWLFRAHGIMDPSGTPTSLRGDLALLANIPAIGSRREYIPHRLHFVESPVQASLVPPEVRRASASFFSNPSLWLASKVINSRYSSRSSGSFVVSLSRV